MAIEYAVPTGSPVTVVLGPFIDAADGKTALTGLAGTMTVRVVDAFNNATDATLDGSITHRGNGYYSVPIDRDTILFPIVYTYFVDNPSVHLPVWQHVQMAGPGWSEHKWNTIDSVGSAPANVRQWLSEDAPEPTTPGVPQVEVASLDDGIDVNVTQWAGTAVATPHTSGYPVVTVKDGTGTGEINTDSGKVSIASNGLDAAALATDAVAEIQSGLATSTALATVAGYLDTEIAAILSRLPTDLVGGRMDASVGAMAANVLNASALATDAVAEIVAGLKALVVESEGSVTFGQGFSLLLSALCGVVEVNEAGTEVTFKTPDGTATRIVVTIDLAAKERTAVTLTPSS